MLEDIFRCFSPQNEKFVALFACLVKALHYVLLLSNILPDSNLLVGSKLLFLFQAFILNQALRVTIN